MATQGNAYGTMGTPGANPDVVMVAERAVNQALDNLRGQLGVKFHELENGDQGLKTLQLKIGDLEQSFENLGDNVTDAFKKNNGLLCNGIQAAKGDIIQQIETKVTKQIEELEKNINSTLQNIKDNQELSGNRNRDETNETWDNKAGKYGFNKESLLNIGLIRI